MNWSLNLATTIMCLGLLACNENTTGVADTTGLAAARVSLWPSATSAAGTVLLVEGEDFAGDCKVRVRLDDDFATILAEAPVNTDGSISVQVAIPGETTPGTHTLEVQGLKGPECDESSRNFAAKPLAVSRSMPLLVLDTIEGRPGSSLTVNGRGFCSDMGCSLVTLITDGGVAANDIKVAEDGTFTTTAQIPAVDNAGNIMVVAMQYDANGDSLRGFGELIVTVRPGGKRPELF